MAIRLDEARLRLLKMCGELSPSINNTYNIGTSSLKFANVYGTTFHGALDGNAATATALTTSAGSTTRPVYFSSGKPTQIALTLPVATIPAGFDTTFRTSINGSTSTSPFLGVVRTDTASVTYAPQYGSGIVWGKGDTHGYLYVSYSGSTAYLGGGNADKLNWVKQIAFTDSNVTSASKLATARTIQINLASTSSASFNGTANITPGVTGILAIGNGGTGANNRKTAITNLGVFGLYSREDIGTSPNFDNPGVNGLFEMRAKSETTGETGTKPFNGFAPFISLRYSNTMLQFAGESSLGFFIRGKQGGDPTLTGIAWQKLLTSNNWSDYAPTKTGSGASGTWGISVTGNAATATKATQDADGNTISSTYLKCSGGTMAGILTLKGNQYEDSFSGALNCNNSNIYRVNSIYTADVSNGAGEGIHFYRDATHVDTLWMNSGNLYFVPNRALGTNTTAANSYVVLHSNNYTSYTVTKTGSGASGTWGISISGNATTAEYPAGFSSNVPGATWGNTIGTSIACWNDPTGGSVDWRRDNPSSGKISMKVDGRVYVNEGSNPVMGMNTSGGFWGMGDPDGNSSNWIRTTSSGIIPYSSGGASALGTNTWPFNTIWSKSQNIIDTYWPSFNLISQTANSKGTYSKGMVEVNYNDSIGMWIHSNKATDAKSRRALVLYGYGQKADASEAIALRQCNTSGTWLSDLYLLHSGNYNSYALPLSGGTISGKIGWSGASAVINSLTSSNYTQGMMIDVGMNGSGIYRGNGDNATTGTGGAANIIIKSWYGVGFATSCYNVTNKGITLNINTRTGDLNTLGKVYGAVWNDYAEYRSTEPIQPGRVVREDKDGIMKLTTERLMPACEIISDTFGFAIGETDECKTPIATTGRVLAYTYEDRYSFELGDAVCSGPNGTVSKMTRQELMMYPERMIGTVSEIPEYKTWGSGNVEVDGRIWIRVR